MRMHFKTLIFLAACLLARLPAAGCPIPVYRYALEFWEADPYIVEVFHKGELNPLQRELAQQLVAASRGGGKGANLEVRMYDIDAGIDEIALGYIRRAAPGEFPWMVVRYPRVTGISEPLWSGALTGTNIDMLLDSPARRSIGEKLSGGATAVWVFLESGNRRKDRAALDLLNRELRRLEQTLVLPEYELWVDGNNADGQTGTLPEITFEILSLSRSDAGEQHFISMLMGSEKDLGGFAEEPFVFPFYGRGIALWAILGDGINVWNIREAAEFLTGPCSCQAKLLNPGVDMLMAVDWDRHVERIADISLANPISGMAGFTGRGEEVRRMLEEATLNRLGSTSRQRADPETDPGKIVYIDIFGQQGSGTGSQPPSPDLDTRRSAGTVTGERQSYTAGQQSGGTTAANPQKEPSTGTGQQSGGTTAANLQKEPSTGTGQQSGGTVITDSRSELSPTAALQTGLAGSSGHIAGQSVSPDSRALQCETSDSRSRQVTDTGPRIRRSSAIDSDGESIRESLKNRISLTTILIIFAAVIGAVIAAGLIIYLKNIR